MINNIFSTGPFINVVGGTGSGVYVNQNQNNPMQGMVRLNGSVLEVFDGSYWRSLSNSSATEISLTPNAVSAIEWAQSKMMEEAKLTELAKRHPAIKDAVDKLNTVMDEIKVLTALTEEN